MVFHGVPWPPTSVSLRNTRRCQAYQCEQARARVLYAHWAELLAQRVLWRSGRAQAGTEGGKVADPAQGTLIRRFVGIEMPVCLAPF